jgi:hypothetical protein
MERLAPVVLDSPTSRKGREKWGTLALSTFWAVTHPFRKGREKDGAPLTLFLWVGGLSFLSSCY